MVEGMLHILILHLCTATLLSPARAVAAVHCELELSTPTVLVLTSPDLHPFSLQAQ